MHCHTWNSHHLRFSTALLDGLHHNLNSVKNFNVRSYITTIYSNFKLKNLKPMNFSYFVLLSIYTNCNKCEMLYKMYVLAFCYTSLVLARTTCLAAGFIEKFHPPINNCLENFRRRFEVSVADSTQAACAPVRASPVHANIPKVK